MVGFNSALTEEKDDNQHPSDTRKVFEILITLSRWESIEAFKKLSSMRSANMLLLWNIQRKNPTN